MSIALATGVKMCAKSGGRSVNASDIVALRLGSLDDELEIVRACRNRLQDVHFHFLRFKEV